MVKVGKDYLEGYGPGGGVLPIVAYTGRLQVYSYFQKRYQKKSKHSISQDRKVVWVVFIAAVEDNVG